MQASTCSAMPRDAQTAATSAMGSRVANGYDGALSTTSATSSASRSSIAAGVVVPVAGSTGTRSSTSPRYSAALWKAACTVMGATMRGTRGVPRRAERQTSRAVFTASMQLSVPPDVTEPTTTPPSSPSSPSPWNTRRANPTSPDSMAATEVNVVGSSPLTGCTSRAAAAASSSSSGSPES